MIGEVCAELVGTGLRDYKLNSSARVKVTDFEYPDAHDSLKSPATSCVSIKVSNFASKGQ